MCGRVGTDIVSVARITRLLEDGGTAFLDRWFTPTEIAYCLAKAVPGRHLAARLAAKEAVLKAALPHWEGPPPWRSIEVVNDERGVPSVRLLGPVAEAAADLDEISVSLAHCDDYATATALASLRAAADRADQILRELGRSPTRDADPRLAALRVAIALEDALGIALTDEDLDGSQLLDDPAGIVRDRSVT